MRCLSCGAEIGGRFCPECGQRADVGRITLRSLVQPLLEAIDCERGLAHTAVALTRRPGEMLNQYLAGRRVEYAGPVKYLVVTVALALLVLWAVGVPAQATPQGTGVAQAMSEVMDRYGNALLLSTVPLLALGTRLCFPARRLNFAEHLVVNAYVFGQQNLVSILFVPLQRIGTHVAALMGAVYFAIIVGYYAVVLRRVFARTWWTAALGAIGVTAVVYAIFLIGFGLILVAMRTRS